VHPDIVRLALAQLIARLDVDYFAYAVRPGSSARHAARHRLLRLRRTFGCLSTSRGSSRGSSSTTSPTPRVRVPRHVTRLVVDYFSYTARPGASACRPARRRLLHLTRLLVDYIAYAARPGASAHRRLLRLVRLVVDYFAYAVHPGASGRVNYTVNRPISGKKKTGLVYRWNRPVHRGIQIIGTVLGWEPDRFMYRAGPIPPGTGRTGPVP
jgi:hypothetical protein